ncbi:MAG: cytochrome c4 [Rhodanobacter sp.]|jgi:cytochrome c553|nr:cytochrome c4 [Rhodanobacter sp.]
MKTATFALAGMLGLAAGLMATPGSATAADQLVGNASAGQSTMESVCALCHGVDGNSMDPQYPKLAGQHANYLAYQIESFKSGQRSNSIMSGMAAMLSKQDIANVAAYLSQQKTSPGPTNSYEPALGKSIYVNGIAAAGLPSCESCHGADGLGDSNKMYPRIAGQHAQYVMQVLTGWHNGEAWGDSPHAKLVVEVAKKLTIEQIHAVSSYVQGLNAGK